MHVVKVVVELVGVVVVGGDGKNDGGRCECFV